MYIFVLVVFIFALGAIFGWGLEVVYRHVADPEKRWFNPGFCVGPWLPIYGIGLGVVYGMTYLEDLIVIDNVFLKRLILFLIMSLCMTLIELIGGIILLKFFNLRLWDYTNEKFNYKGFICLKFSLFWMLISAAYYFLIHPHVNESVLWLSKNLIFSFVIGLFFGIFMVDLIYSANVVSAVKKYAYENNIVVRLEDIKDRIRREKKKTESKAAFFLVMLKENLVNALNIDPIGSKDSEDSKESKVNEEPKESKDAENSKV